MLRKVIIIVLLLAALYFGVGNAILDMLAAICAWTLVNIEKDIEDEILSRLDDFE